MNFLRVSLFAATHCGYGSSSAEEQPRRGKLAESQGVKPGRGSGRLPGASRILC